MAWNWGSAAGGAATGAGTGSAFGPWGTAIGAAGGFILGGALGGGGGQDEFEPVTYVADPEAAAIGGSEEWTVTAPMPEMTEADLVAWIYSGEAEQYIGQERANAFRNQFETALGIDMATLSASVQSVGDSGEMVAKNMGYKSYADYQMAIRNEWISKLATPQGAEEFLNYDDSVLEPEEKVNLISSLNQIRYVMPDEVVVDRGSTTGAEVRGGELEDLSDYLLKEGPITEFDTTGTNTALENAEEAMGDYRYTRSGLLGSADELYGTGMDLLGQSDRARRGFADQLGRTQGMTEDIRGEYGTQISDLDQMIAGNSPSVAALERERAMQAAQKQALSLAATSRDPGAWRDAIYAGQEASNRAAQDAAIMRAAEIQDALGLRGDALSGLGSAMGSLGGLEADVLSTGATAEREATTGAVGAFGDRADVYSDLGAQTKDQAALFEQMARDQTELEQARTGTDLAEFENRTGAAFAAQGLSSGLLTDQARLNVDIQGINAGSRNASTGAQASTHGVDVAQGQLEDDLLYDQISTGIATVADQDPFGLKKKPEDEDEEDA